MDINDFEKEFTEMFGFLLSQEFAKEAPKDTGTLARSFPATFQLIDDVSLEWDVPFYFEFVEFGTVKQKPNPFVRRTLENKSEEIAQRVVDILEKQ